MVDLMKLIHAGNGMTSLDIMNVVSSTENAITLSSADAAKIPRETPIVVKFSDGTYKVVFVQAASGTTVARAAYETTSLENASQIQALHDTVYGGNGQHLSSFGYLAMGQFVAQEILKRNCQKDGNWIAGLIFNQLQLAKGWRNEQANNDVYDADDNLVCSPVYGTNWRWGGYTPNGNSLANERGVNSNNNNAVKDNGWVIKAFTIIQGIEGAYVEFPISCKGHGFVEVVAGLRPSKTTSTGTLNITLYADGTEVGTKLLDAANMTTFRWENVDITNNYTVRFTLNGNLDTEAAIYSIGFWKMWDSVPLANVNQLTRIAVLGDSWTQYPLSGGISGSDYNEIVERPDGTQGDGYGYFPKELATASGAIVDNWGKKDQTTVSWAFPMIDKILEKNYDYIVIEFFLNDRSAGMTMEAWRQNLQMLCDKCSRKNVRPILLMPCWTNSQVQSTGLGIWHEAIVSGIDGPIDGV